MPHAPTRSPSSALLFWGEGSPTKIDYSKKGTLVLTSLLEDLAKDRDPPAQRRTPTNSSIPQKAKFLEQRANRSRATAREAEAEVREDGNDRNKKHMARPKVGKLDPTDGISGVFVLTFSLRV